MQFENSFEVPLPPGEAWAVLLDVPRIAPCLPGAEITETLGPDRYKGRAGVKVGPVNLSFAGEAEIVARDEAAKTARVRAKGSDTKGRGQASAMVFFALRPQGSGTRVDVKTDLNLTGAVAQYGRASGLMKEIAGALLGQFADNLRQEIARSGQAALPGSAPMPPPAVKPISAFALLWAAIKALIARWLGRARENPRS